MAYRCHHLDPVSEPSGTEDNLIVWFLVVGSELSPPKYTEGSGLVNYKVKDAFHPV